MTVICIVSKYKTASGSAFESWVADRRTLTDEEIEDISQQLSALTTGEIAKQLKTKFGQEFKKWADSRDQLTSDEIAELKAKIEDLKTAAAKKTGVLEQAFPTVYPETIIPVTKYPKWWKTAYTAPISLSEAGTQVVVRSPASALLFITTIVLTVSGETNISFGFGVFGSSGAMDLGGIDEPRGMVIAMGESPAPCGRGGFSVTSDGADVAVGGFVTYYLLKEK